MMIDHEMNGQALREIREVRGPEVIGLEPEDIEGVPGKKFKVLRTVRDASGEIIDRIGWDADLKGRKPGSVLIAVAAWLLSIVGGGALFVSFAGQLTYVLKVRHQVLAATIESLLPDVALLVLSLLALGLARAGKPSKTVRALVQAAAFTSAGMNSGAANLGSPRSIAVWVLPPVVCAVCVDQVVSVIRRHVMAIDEPSAWSGFARLMKNTARLIALLALYMLRFIVAAPSTATGVRQLVLAATPLPSAPEPPAADAREGSKRAAFLALYRAHPEYGVKAAATRVSAELAESSGLQAGTARSYAYAEIKALGGEAR